MGFIFSSFCKIVETPMKNIFIIIIFIVLIKISHIQLLATIKYLF